jgi:enoyl-CoA hydratase/carnithine racemase
LSARSNILKKGALLSFERKGEIGILRLNRPAKRNALSDAMVAELDAFFAALPESVRALVLHGIGEHFCAGLDLAELSERSAAQGVAHSRGWHRVFDRIQFGRVPVVAVLHGAVVGGGLELASCAHVRAAEKSAFYAFPEGQRGIFLGGGGSVRVPRLIGTHRVADMMFTGRVLSAAEGQALGISTYLVESGAGLAKGIELARKIASNAPATNFALIHALPRIAELGQDAGLLMESLMAGIAQSEPEAKKRMKDFLEKRAAKVRKSE